MAHGDGDRPDRRGTARVQARCAWCGFVDLESGDLVVHRGAGDDALLEFGCASCRRLNLIRLGPGDLRALEAAGVHATAGPAPFELLERRSGPPITWDDLIDFHQELAGQDPLPAARAELAGGRPERERDAA